MKAKLIEYDYTYEERDSCKGNRKKEARNRAILFFAEEDRPVVIAIPEDGRLKIDQIFLRDGKLCFPIWSKEYRIIGYKPAPFQKYRVVKSLEIPAEQLDIIFHAVVCSMKMDDLRESLIELIRAESLNFAYRI